MAELARFEILDTPRDARFDRLTAIAADQFDVPVAVVSLVGEDRVWFKAAVGFPLSQIPRETSFCDQTITSLQITVVEDARRDPRFQGNQLVAGDPNIVFYAGAPLITSSGICLGSLAIVDTIPRTLGPKGERTLRRLADMAVDALELHRALLERTRAEEEARATGRRLTEALNLANRANEAKAGFLANMSHELRTPLNAILGFAETMTMELYGPHASPKYREYADHIGTAGRHLLEVINDVLDMSKIESGRLELDVTPIALQDELTTVLDIITYQAELKFQTLIVDRRTEDTLHVLADRRAFRQVMLNLIGNAIKFTPDYGRITVAYGATPDGACALIEVIDTGIGIAAKHLPRLGEPFFRPHDNSDTTHPGSGLGVALSKRLLEAMKGSLNFHSVLDKGTTALAKLPLTEHVVSGTVTEISAT